MSCSRAISDAAFGKSNTCSVESGYSFHVITNVPSADEITSICQSDACLECIKAIRAAVPGECTLSWMSDKFQLYAQILNPIAAGCASATTAPPATLPPTTAPKPTTTTPTTTTPTTTTPTIPATTTPTTGVATNSSSNTTPGAITPGATTTTTTTTTNNESGSNSTVLVVAGLGGLLVLALIAFVVLRVRSNRKRKPSFNNLDFSPAGGGHATNGTYIIDNHRTNASSAHATNTRTGPGNGTNSGTATATGTRPSKPPTYNSKVPDGIQDELLDLWSDRAIQRARIPLDHVILGKELSHGAYGQVLLAQYNGQQVALKRLLPVRAKDPHQVGNFLEEAKLMTTLKHPRIVKLLGVGWTNASNLCVVLEFVNGGDLRELLDTYQANHEPQGFTASKVKIALHVIHALSYLHGLKPLVLHRDLKSKNILLSKELDAKLTDFGVSREGADDAQLTSGVGTSRWMAPEVLLGDPYDEKADIFSFGILLSELDTHQVPYADAGEDGYQLPEIAIRQMVSNGELQVTFSPQTDPDLLRMARGCLALDPRDRPTANEVFHFLHHLWKFYAQEAQ